MVPAILGMDVVTVIAPLLPTETALTLVPETDVAKPAWVFDVGNDPCDW